MNACLSPNGCNTYTGEEQPVRLLVATSAGVVSLDRSPDGTWSVTQRGLDGKHISSLLFEPTRCGVFAGVHGAGLYRSDDVGETWNLVEQGLAEEHVYSLGSSVRDDDAVLYAGTEPARLFRSDDYGATWRELTSLGAIPDADRWTFPAPPHEAHVKNVAAHPADPNVLFVGIEQGGLFKSIDGGDSWRELDGYYRPGEVPYKDVHRVVFGSSDTAEMYLTGGTGMYHSSDAGETWRQRTSAYFRVGYPDAIVVAPDDDGLIFMAGAAKSPFFWLQTPLARAAVVRSRDHGRSWDVLDPGMPDDGRANIEAMTIYASRGRISLFIGTTDGEVYLSEDEGETFTRIAAGIAPISKLTHNAILEGSFVRG